MKKKLFRIKCRVKLGCGHFVIEKLPLNLKGLKRFLYLRKRLCCDCWRADQNRRKVWITAKLGMEKLRGSKGQFTSGMYLRGEVALRLLEEGYCERCLIQFLNSEQSGWWWIKNKDRLRERFLEYVNYNEVEVGIVLKRRGIFLFFHRIFMEIEYKLYIIKGIMSYD